jgi:hypothetical protein
MHSKGFLQHLVHLEELFKKLHEVNMKIHPKKCEFVITSVVYLRHRILPNGIMAHCAKVIAILEMPNPIDVHTLRSFIGLCNYYMIYVQNLILLFITYASQSNNKAESNYSSYEGECLAVVWAIIHFRLYFYGTNFTLYTDHRPIKWLMTNDKFTSKLVHWALILQEYEFKVIHQLGITHQNTDTMSWRPLTTSEDLLEAKQDFD